ncbi:MAG: ABC-2 family transporter protein, partial [Patescibacteria group bacterium]
MIKKYLHLYKIFFKTSLIRMMENRFDFVFRFFPTTMTLILNVLMVNFIFSKVNEIAGWQKNELFLLMGTYYIVWGIFFGLFIQNLSRINKYVSRGELDLFLTKPVDSQFYTSTRVTIDFGEAATLVTGIYLVFLSLGQLNIHPSLISSVIYILLI